MNPLPATVLINACDTGPLTLRLTGTVCGGLPAPLGVIVIVPLYVPGDSPAGFTEIVSVLFTLPLVGVTDSQLPPDVVDAAAVNVRVAPGLMMITVCEGGADNVYLWHFALPGSEL